MNTSNQDPKQTNKSGLQNPKDAPSYPGKSEGNQQGQSLPHRDSPEKSGTQRSGTDRPNPQSKPPLDK